MTDAKQIPKRRHFIPFDSQGQVVAVGRRRLKENLCGFDYVAKRLKLWDGATERPSPNFLAETPDMVGFWKL